nr:MAG TPA: hypothetical protein [Caudoviricetes sp.]
MNPRNRLRRHFPTAIYMILGQICGWNIVRRRVSRFFGSF